MARRKTFSVISSEGIQTGNFGNWQNSPISCGVSMYYGLYVGISPKDQARILARALDRNKGIVLISDRVTNVGFKETKAIANQSDEVINPNSRRKIAVWAITREMIPKIYYYAEDQAKLKAKKKSRKHANSKA